MGIFHGQKTSFNTAKGTAFHSSVSSKFQSRFRKCRAAPDGAAPFSFFLGASAAVLGDPG